MKIVIASDSFKGSLTSIEAGNAVKQGILRSIPDADVVVRPMADGGEGTTRALTQALNGIMEYVWVSDPLGNKTRASYGIVPNQKLAIMEMAEAAGLARVTKEDRNPLFTTTFGVGEMIMDAIQKGCRRFIMGIGGSATNDCGVGMLQAMGFDFLDQNGQQVASGAIGLKDIAMIDDKNAAEELEECEFTIACDVSNPLYGEMGCSRIFGPQKGATQEMIANMDIWIHHFAELTAAKYQHADPLIPGTGAAGGLGFAFLAYTNAKLKPGVEMVIEETRLEQFLADADIVVTGEGRMDFQTAMGKTPAGVASAAKKYNKTVIAFAGSISEDAFNCNDSGIDAYFSILPRLMSLDDAMKPENACANLAATAEQVFRLIRIGTLEKDDTM